jgi:hypothetical protein
MMAQNQILISVTELLSKNQFVQIENLGSFFMKEMDASFNPFTHEVKPRHTQIVFNADLSQNDGVLAQYLMMQYGLTFKEANSLISNWVLSTKAKLVEKKYLSFHPLGNFFYNETTGLFFVGRSQANLHPHNFGLKPLIWDPKIHQKVDSQKSNVVIETTLESISIQESEIEEAELVEVTHDLNENSDHVKKTKRSVVWNIAASFAAFAIGATVLYFGAQTIVVLNNNAQTASSSPEFNSSNTKNSSVPPESTEDVQQNEISADLTSPEKENFHTEKEENKAVTSVEVSNKIDGTSKSNLDSKSTNNLAKSKNKSRFIVVAGRVIEIKPKLTTKTNKSNSDTLLKVDEFRAAIVSKKGNYYVVGGSYLTENAAKIEIRQWNKLHREATYFHVAESSLIKIVLKRFKSQQEASEFAVSIKDIPTQSISVQELKLIK